MKLYILSEYDTPFAALENVIGEVIMCKDCKHMHEDGVESYCDDSGRYIDGTGFCKWAERKEE